SPLISDIGGLYMSSPFSKMSIKSFIKNNHIDMSQYEDKKYNSYNDFFTRRIKDGKRPYEKDITKLMSPADSKLSYYQITDQTILKIKDTKYKLKDLLENEQLAKEYEKGICLIFRLAVDDYHRYSYIDNGQIVKRKYIKGLLHTVNPIAYDYYPIYKTNCREYTVIETENFGKVIQMEVGAMMVGKIVNYDHQVAHKGREKGYFEFGGSTIVLFFKEGTVEIDQDIVDNSKQDIETRVLLGETIGHKLGV
ncbi:MAG: phosphatidylserine decarboxylase, partial [Faecalibacillus sp.]